MKLFSNKLVLLAAVLAPAWSDAVLFDSMTFDQILEWHATLADEGNAAKAEQMEAMVAGRKLTGNSPIYTAESDATVLATTLLSPANGATLSGTPSLTGDAACAALFAAGHEIGLDNGIVLSSGIATQLVGPNVGFIGTTFGTAGSPALDAIVGGGTEDACILTFEFTCPAGFSSKPITGKTVWGSEEYPFLGFFNDVAAVFVNGVNVGLVGGQPLTVNNVNCGDGTDPNGPNCGLFNVNTDTNGDPNGAFNTELNGFTNPLPTTFTPGDGINTVSIQVADTNDGAVDSAIHVLSGSFGCCADNIGVCGDPHFITWHGENYDYHGKCDLELLSDPTFADGKGLDVHIRTEILRQWSYIKSAAIRIGDDILEVHGGAQEQAFWVNKEYQAELTTIGGFPVTYHKANSKSHVYTIHMEGGNDDVIEIRTYKEFVRVDFKHPTKSLYGNSVGLLGNFVTGQKLGRDGETVFASNFNEFGQEWQVLPNAPMLFHNVEGPQAGNGEKCVMPSELHAEEKRRRLGQNHVTQLEAEVACHVTGISDRDHDLCVADILAADDLDMRNIYVQDSGAAGSH